MRYRYAEGVSSRPLLIAYHGMGQRSAGLASHWPWYWSFPRMSQLFAACKTLGWSCFMPQVGPWAAKYAHSHVLKARQTTHSYGKLYLFGFSMGAETVYEAANILANRPSADGNMPSGIWGHSGRAPKMEQFTPLSYKVALSCNKEETHALPFNGGRSMHDERQLAYEFYLRQGMEVDVAEGSANGNKPVHRCDPSLNLPILQWMAT